MAGSLASRSLPPVISPSAETEPDDVGQTRDEQVPVLLSQRQARDDSWGWRHAAYTDVAARLADPAFPCIFSKNAFKKELVKLVFVEDLEHWGTAHLARALAEYVELSRDWDGRLDTAHPLIVCFGHRAAPVGATVAEYHAFGWRVLQLLHEVDPAPWPDDVDRDPHSSSWSMCFNGMQLFCNMSTPAHRVRRSRNMGEHFALVINPRERFDVVAGDHPRGRKARAIIRKAIREYDGTPPSPQLGVFGHGGTEWLQYGLVEEQVDDSARTERCPFTFTG